MSPTIKTLATLDIKNMSRRDKVRTLRTIAERTKKSPSAVVNALREHRNTLVNLPHVESMSLENAIATALARVALYNARRCYHADSQS